MTEKLLIVDDDHQFRFAMRKLVETLGYLVTDTDNTLHAIELINAEKFDIALVDLQMGDTGGLDVLRGTPKTATRIIVLTGNASVGAAVDAMKLGAFSFLEKPVESSVLAPLLIQAAREVKRLRGSTASPPAGFVGMSEAAREVTAFLARVGPTDETVTIYGETGSGKEVSARQLHAMSLRASGPFVALNAATVPRELFESELFGHKKGSFTGASSDRLGVFREAEGGTLFIDEVGELPLDSQAKLLRALEERKIRPLGESREIPVNARIVAATNRDLWVEVRAGRFREDLYFRLQVFPVRIPPLRERIGDIESIALALLDRIGASAKSLDREAVEVLEQYPWPGNVRELLNVLRRASLFAAGDKIDASLVRKMVNASIFTPKPSNPIAQQEPSPSAATNEPSSEVAPSIGPPNQTLSLADVEKKHIERTLARNGGNITKAAVQLGIDRRTLQRKMRAYGMAVIDDS